MPSRDKRGVDRKGNIYPADPRKKKKCLVCGKDMLVAGGPNGGQLAKYHKECRKLRHNKNK